MDFTDMIRSGLVKVDVVGGTTPSDYVIEITNGSGVKYTTVTANSGHVAYCWGVEWAQNLRLHGEGNWQVRKVVPQAVDN